METQGTLVAQRNPGCHIGAAFFQQTISGGVPQGNANALVPVGRGCIDSPDLAGGLAGFFITGTVKADKANDLVAVNGDLDLWLTLFNSFAPVSLALFNRGHGLQLIIGNQTSISLQCGSSMDLGNRFCIAKSSGTDLDTRHGKTGAETCKNRRA